MDPSRSSGSGRHGFLGSSGDLTGRTLGPYRVVRELAKGGQGAVLEAVHTQLGTRVALKVLRGDDPVEVGRFRQEAQVLARLSHPNLIRIHDMGVIDDVSFIAMELVEGLDLKSLLKQRGVPDPSWSARTLAAIAEVLHMCHGVGIVHRDLKPHNILIEVGTERPVLVDFGLIKRDPERFGGHEIEGAGLSITGEIKGTPSYMAPEQADPTVGAIGPRTDVYALGATLYTLLTGVPPFEGEASYNVYVKLLSTPPKDPRALNPAIPDALAELCLRALAKSADERPESAQAFAGVLRAVDAAPVPSPERGRAARLGGVGVAMLAVGVAVGAAGVALSTRAPAPEPPVSGGGWSGPEARQDPVAATPPQVCRVRVPARGALTVRAVSGDLVVERGVEEGERVEVPPGRYRFALLGDERVQTLDLDVVGDTVLAFPPPRDELRWAAQATNHANANPVLVDLDGDGVRDVVIHAWPDRRQQVVVGLDGVRGRFLWQVVGAHAWGESVLQVAERRVLFTGLRDRAGKSKLVRLDPVSGEVIGSSVVDPLDLYRPPPRGLVPLDPAGLGTEGYALPILYEHNRGREKRRIRDREAGQVIFVDAAGERVAAFDPTRIGRAKSEASGRELSLVDLGQPLRAVFWAYQEWFFLLQLQPDRSVRLVRPPLNASGPLRRSQILPGTGLSSPDHKRVAIAWSLKADHVELAYLTPSLDSSGEQWRTTIPGELEGPCLAFVRLGQRDLVVVAVGARGRHELRFFEEQTGSEVGAPLAFPGAIYMVRYPFQRAGRTLLLVCTQEPWRHFLVDLETREVVWASPNHETEKLHFRAVIGDLEGDGRDELVQVVGSSGRVSVIDPTIPGPLGQ